MAVERSSVYDVARLAGVSSATVSRALRGLPNVADETRRRVQSAAAQLNYSPDPHAARLASGRSNTVGVVVPDLGHWYFSKVLDGIEQELTPVGYDLLLYGSDLADLHERGLGSVAARVDGLIVVDQPPSSAFVEDWADCDRPLIVIGWPTAGATAVGIDDRQGAALAVRHLVNLGHRRIGCIGCRPDDDTRFEVPERRRAGYRDAILAAGLEFDGGLEVACEFAPERGMEAMAELLALPEPPTAVFAFSDELAFGAMAAIEDHGMRVPDDISVVGFDDHELSAILGLSTIRQDPAEIGRTAAVQVLAEVEGIDRADHEVRTRLVVRRSTRRLTR